MPKVHITLRAARVNLGLTLRDAADEFKINHETLANYERDSSNVPRSFFIKIESVYGIPVDMIYFGKQEDFFLEMRNRIFSLNEFNKRNFTLKQKDSE